MPKLIFHRHQPTFHTAKYLFSKPAEAALKNVFKTEQVQSDPSPFYAFLASGNQLWAQNFMGLLHIATNML